MAIYGVDIRTGLAHNNEIGFTGWTPTLGRGATPPQYGSGTTAGSVQFNGQSQNDDRISKQFRKMGPAMKVLKTLFFNQMGNVAGTGSGTVTYKQVKGTTGDNYASNRAIEIVGATNRLTTNADVLAMRGMMNRLTAPAVYPRDVSGNGGGGKVKF